jgi:hypothetical protein
VVPQCHHIVLLDSLVTQYRSLESALAILKSNLSLNVNYISLVVQIIAPAHIFPSSSDSSNIASAIVFLLCAYSMCTAQIVTPASFACACPVLESFYYLLKSFLSACCFTSLVSFIQDLPLLHLPTFLHLPTPHSLGFTSLGLRHHLWSFHTESFPLGFTLPFSSAQIISLLHIHSVLRPGPTSIIPACISGHSTPSLFH